MRIRIVNLDFYMHTPVSTLDIVYSDFRGSSVNHVPVIRIYGSSEIGLKTCLHVHGVFPYIYIPYDGQTPSEGFLYQVASGLDKAINLSLGQASATVQHVYKVSLVSGIPFYGFHPKQHQYLKIYFYNPLIIKKATTLLQNGSILGKIYQPHEAHIPYILQFMIDYNLHGMSFIEISDFKYRVDPSDPNDKSYPEDTLLPISVSKMSVCKLEIDTNAECITNRMEITKGKLTVNPGIKALWDDEKQRRRNKDEDSQIDHILTQNREDLHPTATHRAFKTILDDKLKIEPKNDGNTQLSISVYPAETPSTLELSNASTIESHISSQNSDNINLDETVLPELNATNINDISLDEDGQNLYEILKNLMNDEEDEEKDSILSQLPRESESEEEDVDISFPLNAVQTPKKIEVCSNNDIDNFHDDSYFETSIRIPQLDGSHDKIPKISKGKKRKIKNDGKNVSMVDLVKNDVIEEMCLKEQSNRKFIVDSRKELGYLDDKKIYSTEKSKKKRDTSIASHVHTAKSRKKKKFKIKTESLFSNMNLKLNKLSNVTFNISKIVEFENSNVDQLDLTSDLNLKNNSAGNEMKIKIKDVIEVICKKVFEVIKRKHKSKLFDYKKLNLTQEIKSICKNLDFDQKLFSTDESNAKKVKNKNVLSVQNEEIIKLIKKRCKKYIKNYISSKTEKLITDLPNNIKTSQNLNNVFDEGLENLKKSSVSLSMPFISTEISSPSIHSRNSIVLNEHACDLTKNVKTKDKFKSKEFINDHSLCDTISINRKNSKVCLNKSTTPFKKRKLHSTIANEQNCIAILDNKAVKSAGGQRSSMISNTSRSSDNSNISTNLEDKALTILLRYSNRSTEYNLRPRVVRTKFDGDTGTHKTKCIKKSKKAKNKQTQTTDIDWQNYWTETIFGKPITLSTGSKPVRNYILTRKSPSGYHLKVRHSVDSSKFKNNLNIKKPKFKIVAAKRPYTYRFKKKIKRCKYPNTTWSQYVPDSTMINTKTSPVLITSNYVLDNDEKFDPMTIAKGKAVNMISPKYNTNDKEIKLNNNHNYDNLDLFDANNLLEDIFLENNVDQTLVDTYKRNNFDDIDQQTLKTLNNLYDEIQDDCYQNYNINDINNDIKSNMNNSFEQFVNLEQTPLLENFKDDDLKDVILNEFVCNNNDSKLDGVKLKDRNEHLTKLYNYRSDMDNNYKNILEKLENSFQNLIDDVQPIVKHNIVSNKLILNNIKEIHRKEQKKILVHDHFKRRKNRVSFIDVCKVRKYEIDDFIEYTDDFVKLTDFGDNSNIKYKISQEVIPSKRDLKKDYDILAPEKENVLISKHKSTKLLQIPAKDVDNTIENDSPVDENIVTHSKNNLNKKLSSNTKDVSYLNLTIHTDFEKKSRLVFKQAINTITQNDCNKNTEKQPVNIIKDCIKNSIHTHTTCTKKLKFDSRKTKSTHKQSKTYKNIYEICANSMNSNKNNTPSIHTISDDVLLKKCVVNVQRSALIEQRVSIKTSNLKHKNRQNDLLNSLSLPSTSKVIDKSTHIVEVGEISIDNDGVKNLVPGFFKIKSLNVFKKKKKLREEKRHHLLNRYLDGTNDSSSTDEDLVKPVPKKKSRKSRKDLSHSKYSPLRVQYSSPTKNHQSILNSALQQPLNPTISISIQTDVKNISSSKNETLKANKNDTQQKHRRKLSFSEVSPLNCTQIQEKIECKFTSSPNSCLKKFKIIENINVKSTTKIEDEAFCDGIKIFNNKSGKKQYSQSISAENLNTSLEESNIEAETLITSHNISSETSDNSVLPIINFVNTVSTRNDYDISSNSSNQDNQINKINQNTQPSDELFSANSVFNSKFSEVFAVNENDISENEGGIEDLSVVYDVINNFIPLAGSSKAFTSEYNNIEPIIELFSESSKTEITSSNEKDLLLSQKIIILSSKSNKSEQSIDYAKKDMQIVSSGGSHDTVKSGHITPYQKENTKNCLPLSFESNESEKSTDYIKPYQENNTELLKNEIESSFDSDKTIQNNSDNSNKPLTPYQEELGNQSSLYAKAKLSFYESFNRNILNDSGPDVIVPKYNPPSRNLIESTLSEFNIPNVRHQEPFYSDVKDVTGNMEVGLRVLKIPSNKVMDVPEFESNYTGIQQYRKKELEDMYPSQKLTNREINNYKSSFCKDGLCLITPAKLPPTREEVKKWLSEQSLKKTNVTKVMEKKKIFIPCSPGADNDDSNDSITLSPCTPLDETLKNVDDANKTSQDFKSFSYIPNNDSPILKRNKRLRRNKERLKETLNSDKDTNSDYSDSINKTPTNLSKILGKNNKVDNSCQVTGITLNATDNFAISCHNLQDAKAVSEHLFLTILTMELIIETRNDNKPNPQHDIIKGIVYTIYNDFPENSDVKRKVSGCFLLNNTISSPTKCKFSILDGVTVKNIKLANTEEDLLQKFISFLTECDPDIIVGYEIQMLSWGYLIERGYVLNLNLINLLSRIPTAGKGKNEENITDLTIPGRIVLDFWRLLRHEIAVQSYTFESVVYHILHERIPMYSFKTLTCWWNHASGLYRNKVLNYFYDRVEAIVRIMDQLDLIGRTSELAKLFGIQFYEVFSRGSQFRVESMMLRLAKPLNYIPVSPSVQQRAKMKAPESLPLIMEPESKFYVDPVIVLDFQSLYPSMIIAYNYCFSTCLGRVAHLGQNTPFEFGASQLKIPRRYIKSLHKKDLINISPCGVAYVKKKVRQGILPRMLHEILDTRLMVKKSLKENSNNKTLRKVLDARQLGLKLIANVTYGYTAANFSGRMPCIEVGDSVVSKGRETLQRAINLVENTPKWGARVVYGDTDSLFVLVSGKSKDEAFKIGAEIAEAVTNDNPSPVKLKLEKIFHPCILQTKKRYVGYIYESPDQEEPVYCAKGIETVRRDGCPAVSKMLEKCLRILFDTRDVSLIRQYIVRQFSKILSGRVSIQDLTFAKEYRGSENYRPGACVPALELARKWIATDKRSEPRRSERVPYIIVNGPPGLPLIRLVRSPRDLIADPSLRPNVLYYITKVIIPPINRCLLLIGADLNNWFNDMPRKQFQYLYTASPTKEKKSTISQYFSTKNCVVCGQQSKDGLCDNCLIKPQETAVTLYEKVRIWERNFIETKSICESCTKTTDKIACCSLDCPVYYRRIQTEKDLQQSPFVRSIICQLPQLDF